MANASTLTVGGLAELNRVLLQFPRYLRMRVWMNAFRAGANVFRMAAIQNAKGFKRTTKGRPKGSKRVRHIYQSIRLRKKNLPGKEIAFSIGCSDRRAHLVEFGTSPHVIDRRKSKRAVFLRNRGGMPIGDGKFATVVRHPGQRAQPFMRPAFDTQYRKAIGVIVRKCAEGIESVVSQLSTSGSYSFPKAS